MKISDDKKIKDIQQEFQQLFPYLQLHFYKGRHKEGKPSPPETQLDPELSIGEVRTIHNEGELTIQPEMTVGELENLFWTKYGLNVQIFRRSGNLWLQTTKTDTWTLAEQNRKGGHSEQAWKEMHGED
ncbi:MAG: hypothetical protein D6816_16940 [Bacteroidetes bacterium]|nr:MAG: hypothetical protein D6816_16940 [Bacteroidota bacterium]